MKVHVGSGKVCWASSLKFLSVHCSLDMAASLFIIKDGQSNDSRDLKVGIAPSFARKQI